VAQSVVSCQLRPAGPVEPPGGQVLGLAGVGVGGLLLAAAYKLSDGRFGLFCPLKSTTGLDCPLCGTTRATAAAFNGDWAAAWGFNAPMLLVLPVVAVAVGYQLSAWALERARLVRLPRIRISRRRQDALTKVFLVAMLVFGVLRNLV
jgi:Protein of unknown function (DUF2752)